MTVVENSIVCRFFLALWSALTGAWESSGVGNALRRFSRGVGENVRGLSLIHI